MSTGRWQPWRALRDRPHLSLRWVLLPVTARGGRLEERPDGRTILLDPRLGRRARCATLAHELVHDERDVLYLPGTPPGLVAKEEAAVDRIVAERLVPIADLARFVACRADVGPVLTYEVGAEFDVPSHVADRALRLLSRAVERPRRRHDQGSLSTLHEWRWSSS